jgi:hypothetical protein
MGIIRKVTVVGGCRGITLPAAWLEWIRRKYGVEIREVELEIDDVITITPIIPKDIMKTPQAKDRGLEGVNTSPGGGDGQNG